MFCEREFIKCCPLFGSRKIFLEKSFFVWVSFREGNLKIMKPADDRIKLLTHAML